MPISLERAQKHVQNWSSALARFSNSQWPSFLFHAAQFEAAIEIIKSAKIICRDSQQSLICDVANQGALGNNLEAHKYARLYFRPKNGFHLKTEGIKALEDHNRIDPHMTIPVTFLFDFVGVLCGENSYFTQGNFAKSNVMALDGDENFDALDFSQIYHDSDPGSKGTEIRNMRMSEVVVPGELSLTHLRAIACRTINEARMLTQSLHGLSLPLPHIVVDQRGSIFFKTAIFVSDIYIKDDTLYLAFPIPYKLF